MFVIHVLYDLGCGGTEKVVSQLAVQLDKLGVKQKIITLKNADDCNNFFSLPPSVEIINFPCLKSFNYKLLSYYQIAYPGNELKKTALAFEKLIDKLSPDIVHFHINPTELPLAHFIKKNKRSKLVYTDHVLRLRKTDYDFFRFYFLKKFFRKLYSGFNLICVSPVLSKHNNSYKISDKNKKHITINNGVETGKYDCEKKNDSQPVVFIYVSRVNKMKGHGTLLAAWEKFEKELQAKNKSFELWIVGPMEKDSGVDEKYFNNPNIKFLGLREDVKELLCKSHIGVFPSLSEGLPLALIEKMACGLPVIASDIPELKEIITDNEDGLFFEAGNADDLCEKMILLYNNSSLREKIGTNAREKVQEEYSSDKAGVKHLEFYKSI